MSIDPLFKKYLMSAGDIVGRNLLIAIKAKLSSKTIQLRARIAMELAVVSNGSGKVIRH